MNLQMKINPETKEGDTTAGGDYRYHPFGDSAITAISAAKLGGDCVFATRFGDDVNGKRLYEYYKNCGISKQLMRKDPYAQTGMSITLFSDLDEHENFVSQGASVRFTKEEIDDAFITMPDLFLAPLEEIGYEEHTVVVSAEEKENTPGSEVAPEDIPLPETMIETSEYPLAVPADIANAASAEQIEGDDTGLEENEEDASAIHTDKIISSETVSSYRKQESLALYALQQAEDRKIDLLLQYTPFTSQFPLESLQNIRVLVISDEMLYSLTGFFPNNTDKALRALVAFSQRIKAKYYVVQQGDDNVFIYDGNRYEVISAPNQVRSRTKEAGKKMQQTFMGALAAEYLDSKNIIRACRFALIVSLLTRGKFGNLEKVMSRTELEHYAAENGFDLYK